MAWKPRVAASVRNIWQHWGLPPEPGRNTTSFPFHCDCGPTRARLGPAGPTIMGSVAPGLTWCVVIGAPADALMRLQPASITRANAAAIAATIGLLVMRG